MGAETVLFLKNPSRFLQLITLTVQLQLYFKAYAELIHTSFFPSYVNSWLSCHTNLPANLKQQITRHLCLISLFAQTELLLLFITVD